LTFFLDGKPHPDPGVPGATVTWTAVGDAELNNVTTKDGQLYHASSRKVSPDGKTMTVLERVRMSDGTVVSTSAIRARTSGEASGFWGTWRNVSSRNETPSNMDLNIAADGKVILRNDPPGFEFDAEADGKDYPVRTQAPKTTVAITPVSKTSWVLTTKRDGKPVVITTWSISADGKTLAEEQTLPGTKERVAATSYVRAQRGGPERQ